MSKAAAGVTWAERAATTTLVICTGPSRAPPPFMACHVQETLRERGEGLVEPVCDHPAPGATFSSSQALQRPQRRSPAAVHHGHLHPPARCVCPRRSSHPFLHSPLTEPTNCPDRDASAILSVRWHRSFQPLLCLPLMPGLRCFPSHPSRPLLTLSPSPLLVQSTGRPAPCVASNAAKQARRQPAATPCALPPLLSSPLPASSTPSSAPSQFRHREACFAYPPPPPWMTPTPTAPCSPLTTGSPHHRTGTCYSPLPHLPAAQPPPGCPPPRRSIAFSPPLTYCSPLPATLSTPTP